MIGRGFRGVRRALAYLLGLPKSIYVNIRLCPSCFWRLPILVSFNTRLPDLSGRVVFNTPRITIGVFRIGFGTIEHFDPIFDSSILCVRGDLVVCGKAKLGVGARLMVDKGAVLTIGANFKMSAGSKILCSDAISIGEGVLVSWDVLIMDSDQHRTYYDNVENEISKPVQINDNVWIGCRSYIGKGVSISRGSIVAANSAVVKPVDVDHVVVAGCAAKVIKNGVQWRE